VKKVTLPAEPVERLGIFDEENGQSSPSPNWVRVSPFGDVLEAEPNHGRETATVGGEFPFAFNGIIQEPGDEDWFRFSAKKDQLTVGRDHQAKVWDQNGAGQAAFKEFKDMPLLAAFTHDGQRILVGDWSGEISVWSGDGRQRLGDVAGNPPPRDTRSAQTREQLPALEKAAADSTSTLEMAAAAFGAKTGERDALRAALEPAVRERAAMEAELAQAKDAVASTQTARDLAAQELVVRRDAELAAANAAVPPAQAAFEAAAKRVADHEAALAAIEPEVAKPVEAE